MRWHDGHVVEAGLLQHGVHPVVVLGHRNQAGGNLGALPQQKGWEQRGRGWEEEEEQREEGR